MFTKKHRGATTLLSLLIIVGIGAYVRFSRLSSIPPGLTLDEVSISYNAFTIGTTGKDQDGKAFPITHFRSLADYKLSLPIYLASVSQYFFGTGAFAIRFPSALFGTLTVLATFLLAKVIFGKRVGLLASGLLAISPWHVFHSHLGLETNSALFWSVSSLYLLIAAKRKPILYLLWALCFTATMYSHHAFWLFLPPITLICLFTRGPLAAPYAVALKNSRNPNTRKTYLAASLTIVVVLLLPLVFEKGNARHARFEQSFFSKERMGIFRNEALGYCRVEDDLCVGGYVLRKTLDRMANQYVSAFSFVSWYMPTSFDLVNVMPNRGLFYFVELPLLFWGLVTVTKKPYRRFLPLFVSWFLLYPLPLVATTTMSAARMYHLLPLPHLLEALGLSMLLTKSRLLIIPAVLLFLFATTRMVSDMWFAYPYTYSRYAEYGSTAIESFIKRNPSKHIYIEEPLYHPLRLYVLYNVLPNDIPPRSEDRSGRIAGSARNVIITERGYLPPNEATSILISFKEDIPKYFKESGTIDLLDQSPYAYISSKN